MTQSSQPTLLDQWRLRFGGRCRRSQTRPFAAMGYLTEGPVVNHLVEIEKLTLVLIHDHVFRPGCCAVRVAGYFSSRVSWGVHFGGDPNCLFVKDLALQPVQGARGYRIDVDNEELLEIALVLNRQIDHHARFRLNAYQRLFLPKLWAAFRPADAATITGDGPELLAYAARTGKAPQRLLHDLRREHQGLLLYPLAWTSHIVQQALTIFADLHRFPRWPVFRLESHDDLTGFNGAAEFDFRAANKQRALACA